MLTRQPIQPIPRSITITDQHRSITGQQQQIHQELHKQKLHEQEQSMHELVGDVAARNPWPPTAASLGHRHQPTPTGSACHQWMADGEGEEEVACGEVACCRRLPSHRIWRRGGRCSRPPPPIPPDLAEGRASPVVTVNAKCGKEEGAREKRLSGHCRPQPLSPPCHLRHCRASMSRAATIHPHVADQLLPSFQVLALLLVSLPLSYLLRQCVVKTSPSPKSLPFSPLSTVVGADSSPPLRHRSATDLFFSPYSQQIILPRDGCQEVGGSYRRGQSEGCTQWRV